MILGHSPGTDTIPEGVFDDLVYPEDDPEYENTRGSTAVHRIMVKRDQKKIEKAMEQEYELMGPILRQIWDVGFLCTQGENHTLLVVLRDIDNLKDHDNF